MKDNKSAFDSNEYDKKIRQTLPYYDDISEQIIELVKVLQDKVVSWLDVGSGTGKMADAALKDDGIFIAFENFAPFTEHGKSVYLEKWKRYQSI